MSPVATSTDATTEGSRRRASDFRNRPTTRPASSAASSTRSAASHIQKSPRNVKRAEYPICRACPNPARLRMIPAPYAIAIPVKSTARSGIGNGGGRR